jgi:AcrR family transcriptional regulator
MKKKKEPGRKEREQEQRKQYILSCAEELFAENSYDNTSMAMIAEKSEFSVGTVYNFFPSKSDIYSSLLIGKLTEVYEGLSLIAKKVIKPLEKIRGMIKFNMDMIHKNEKFLMLYMNDVVRHEWGIVSNS